MSSGDDFGIDVFKINTQNLKVFSEHAASKCGVAIRTVNEVSTLCSLKKLMESCHNTWGIQIIGKRLNNF